MDKFADIRPYYDNEVESIIKMIIADKEFISTITNFKLSKVPDYIRPIFNPILRFVLNRQVKGITTVADFQKKVVDYLIFMINTQVKNFTVSGLDKLDMNKAYLFVGNHRDIVLDPALVNYARFLNGGDTVRIAVGDNLLSKEFISHLIRINKSFIVKRSAKAPRKLLEALKMLSDYIHHSLFVDNECIWIAQREGRAKDGLDRTDPAIIKMFAINHGRKDEFCEYIKSLHIVPVSISYEYDPCDLLKAKELYEVEQKGNYVKEKGEDITSIATGITGYKGNIHMSFGEVLQHNFSTSNEVALWLDQQIINSYVLHPSNYFAYQCIYGEYPKGVYSDKKIEFNAAELVAEKAIFDEHMKAIPEQYRPYVLKAYANAIVSKKELASALE